MLPLTSLLLPILMQAAPINAADAVTPPPNAPDDIVVHGNTLDQMDRLIRRMAPSRYAHQLARWHKDICVHVIGLDAQPLRRDFVRDRIEETARTLDVGVAGGNCRGNLIVVFSDGADRLTHAVLDRAPWMLKDIERNGLPHHYDKAPFLAPLPVRWFGASDEMDNNTGLSRRSPTQGVAAGAPSRISTSTIEATEFAYAIVDEARLGSVTWNQLSDYLAFVMLANPKIDGDYSGDDSILSLFAAPKGNGTAPRRMTDQDRIFLHGLYYSHPNRAADAQQAEIRDRLLHPRKGDHDG